MNHGAIPDRAQFGNQPSDLPFAQMQLPGGLLLRDQPRRASCKIFSRSRSFWLISNLSSPIQTRICQEDFSTSLD
jgi:hypothetical protein